MADFEAPPSLRFPAPPPPIPDPRWIPDRIATIHSPIWGDNTNMALALLASSIPNEHLNAVSKGIFNAGLAQREQSALQQRLAARQFGPVQTAGPGSPGGAFGAIGRFFGVVMPSEKDKTDATARWNALSADDQAALGAVGETLDNAIHTTAAARETYGIGQATVNLPAGVVDLMNRAQTDPTSLGPSGERLVRAYLTLFPPDEFKYHGVGSSALAKYVGEPLSGLGRSITATGEAGLEPFTGTISYAGQYLQRLDRDFEQTHPDAGPMPSPAEVYWRAGHPDSPGTAFGKIWVADVLGATPKDAGYDQAVAGASFIWQWYTSPDIVAANAAKGYRLSNEVFSDYRKIKNAVHAFDAEGDIAKAEALQGTLTAEEQGRLDYFTKVADTLRAGGQADQAGEMEARGKGLLVNLLDSKADAWLNSQSRSIVTRSVLARTAKDAETVIYSQRGEKVSKALLGAVNGTSKLDPVTGAAELSRRFRGIPPSVADALMSTRGGTVEDVQEVVTSFARGETETGIKSIFAERQQVSTALKDLDAGVRDRLAADPTGPARTQAEIDLTNQLLVRKAVLDAKLTAKVTPRLEPLEQLPKNSKAWRIIQQGAQTPFEKRVANVLAAHWKIPLPGGHIDNSGRIGELEATKEQAFLRLESQRGLDDAARAALLKSVDDIEAELRPLYASDGKRTLISARQLSPSVSKFWDDIYDRRVYVHTAPTASMPPDALSHNLKQFEGFMKAAGVPVERRNQVLDAFTTAKNDSDFFKGMKKMGDAVKDSPLLGRRGGAYMSAVAKSEVSTFFDTLANQRIYGLLPSGGFDFEHTLPVSDALGRAVGVPSGPSEMIGFLTLPSYEKLLDFTSFTRKLSRSIKEAPITAGTVGPKTLRAIGHGTIVLNRWLTQRWKDAIILSRAFGAFQLRVIGEENVRMWAFDKAGAFNSPGEWARYVRSKEDLPKYLTGDFLGMIQSDIERDAFGRGKKIVIPAFDELGAFDAPNFTPAWSGRLAQMTTEPLVRELAAGGPEEAKAWLKSSAGWETRQVMEQNVRQSFESVGRTMKRAGPEVSVIPTLSPVSPRLAEEGATTYGPLVGKTERLFHETAPGEAVGFIEGAGFSAGVGGARPIYMSNDPALALGQGGNKGILLEFDTEGLYGRLDMNKPAAEVALESGSAEFQVYGKGPDYRTSLRSVTVKPGVEMKGYEGSVLRRLEDKGWQRTELADGSVVYQRPGLAGTVGATDMWDWYVDRKWAELQVVTDSHPKLLESLASGQAGVKDSALLEAERTRLRGEVAKLSNDFYSADMDQTMVARRLRETKAQIAEIDRDLKLPAEAVPVGTEDFEGYLNELVRRGEVKPPEVISGWGKDSLPPKTRRSFRTWMYEDLIGKPDSYFARKPLFRQFQTEEFQRLKTLGWSDEAAQSRAIIKAARSTSDVMYDLATRTSTQRFFQGIAPFAPAWQELLETYAWKIPSQFYPGLGHLWLARKANLLSKLGNDLGIDFSGVANVPFVGDLFRHVWGGSVPTSFTFHPSSANFITAGGGLISGPPLGPIPGAALAALRPHVHNGTFDAVAGFLQPFGPDVQLGPTTINRLYEAISGKPAPWELQSARAQEISFNFGYQTALNQVYLEQKKGLPQPKDFAPKGEVANMTDQDRLKYQQAVGVWMKDVERRANQRVRVWSLIRGLGSAMWAAPLGVTDVPTEEYHNLNDALYRQAAIAAGVSEDQLTPAQISDFRNSPEGQKLYDDFTRRFPGAEMYLTPTSINGLTAEALPNQDLRRYGQYINGSKELLTDDQRLNLTMYLNSRTVHDATVQAIIGKYSDGATTPEDRAKAILTHYGAFKDDMAAESKSFDDYTKALGEGKDTGKGVFLDMVLRSKNQDKPHYTLDQERLLGFLGDMNELLPLMEEGGIKPKGWKDLRRGIMDHLDALNTEYGEIRDPTLKALREYINSNDDYFGQVDAIYRQIDNTPNAQQGPLFDKLRHLADQQVGQNGYPSPEEFVWYTKSAGEQRETMAKWATRRPEWLTAFQRRVLGYQDTPNASAFVDLVNATYDAVHAVGAREGYTSNAYVDAKAQRLTTLGQRALAGGLTPLWREIQAPPYRRLVDAGYDLPPGYMQLATQADFTWSLLRGKGVVPGGTSDAAISAQRGFYSVVERMRKLNPTLDDWFGDLEVALAPAGRAKRPKQDLYAALFFDNWNGADAQTFGQPTGTPSAGVGGGTGATVPAGGLPPPSFP